MAKSDYDTSAPTIPRHLEVHTHAECARYFPATQMVLIGFVYIEVLKMKFSENQSMLNVCTGFCCFYHPNLIVGPRWSYSGKLTKLVYLKSFP